MCLLLPFCAFCAAILYKKTRDRMSERRDARDRRRNRDFLREHVSPKYDGFVGVSARRGYKMQSH